MNRIQLSMMLLLTSATFSYAGGDISPITVYESDDVVMATEAYEESIPMVVEAPKVVEPKPVEVVKERPPVAVVPTQEGHGANGFYVGLGITGVRYESACDCSNGGGSEDNIALVGRVGYDFNRYIGLEARGMSTVSGDGGADVDHIGLFVKPMYPLTDATNVYALIGAAKTKSTGDLQNVDAESLALGGGLEFDLSKDNEPKEQRYSRAFDGQGDQEKGVGLFIDYEKLVVKSDSPDFDTISAGVTYDF